MKKILYVFVVALMTMFVSCDKNENVVDDQSTPTNPEELYAKTEYNLDMRDFAMAVNEAINANKSFRKLIKEEAMKKFDGDYDVLLTNIVDKPVAHNDVDNGINTPNKAKTNFTVCDLLEDAFFALAEKDKIRGISTKSRLKLSDSRQKSIANNQSIISELTEKYPDLQISVPIHLEDLEDESYIAPVVFIPYEVDEETTKYLPAFIENEITFLDANNEPDDAVIVIGMNERIKLPVIDAELAPIPTNLAAQPTNAGILLTWKKSIDATPINTVGYNIYRKYNNDGGYYKIGNTVGLNNVSFTDFNISYGSTYSYSISAYNSNGESDRTQEVSETTSALESPEKIIVNTASAAKTLDIEWDATKIGESYEIYRRKTGEINFTKLTENIGLYNNFFTDTNLEGGAVYSYKVRAKNSANAYSTWSKTTSLHASDRQLDSELKVASIYFPDKGSVEPWWRGDPELLLVVTGSIGDNNASIILNSGMIQTSGVSNNEWYTLNLQVSPHWNPNSTGSVYVFEWSEMDGGGTKTYTISSSYEEKRDNTATVKSGASLTYESNKGNDRIGIVTVAWWEAISTEYKCSNMYWKLN